MRRQLGRHDSTRMTFLLLPLLNSLLGGLLALVVSLPGVPFDATWPLDPTPDVVRGFAPQSRPWGPGHRGVDLLGSMGQPVRAARAGTVSYAGPLAGRGVVVVGHGSLRTTYEPVVPGVHVGQRVSAGQVVGLLALVGSHCFPSACLHWGLLRGEEYLDPLSLVGGSRVRLLPWLSGPTLSEPPEPSPAVALAAPPEPGVRVRPADAPTGTPFAAGRW